MLSDKITSFFFLKEEKAAFNEKKTTNGYLKIFIHHYYTPVEDGTYYGITRGGRAGGQGASSSLSGAYLQNYSS